MAAIFENFLKSCHVYFLITLGVENFDEIALSLTVKETAYICVFTFLVKIQNGRHFWNFLKSATLGVENFDEIVLSLTVKEIAYILRFYIFGENSKIQNGRHFWKFFEKWA